MGRVYLFLTFIFIGLGWLVFSIFIQREVTPSAVYTRTELIKTNLQLFAEAKGINYEHVKKKHITNRQSRHVMQKSREILQRLDRFKQSIGLKKVTYPTFPVRRVDPSNVMVLVSLLSNEVIEMGKHYLTVPIVKTAVHYSGKQPSDVYMNLDVISQYLDILGAKPHTPSDAYQIAHTAVRETQLICETLSINCQKGMPAIQMDKIPQDVYMALRAITPILQNINSKLDQPINGGVLFDELKENTIVPADVLSLLNVTIADIGAIKQSLGVKAPTILQVRPNDYTPSQVFQQVQMLNGILTDINAALSNK